MEACDKYHGQLCVGWGMSGGSAVVDNELENSYKNGYQLEGYWMEIERLTY